MFTKRIYHFRLLFPLPLDKSVPVLLRVRHAIRKIHTAHEKTPAICVSFSGQVGLPQTSFLLCSSLSELSNRIPITAFLEDEVTSLTYVAASGARKIYANPYCMIGEIGTTCKRYPNIEKLLSLVKVKCVHLGVSANSDLLWNMYENVAANEGKLAAKWLNSVEETMLNNVSQKRNIPMETVKANRNKLFTAKQATEIGLIDGQNTMESYCGSNFPNIPIECFTFSQSGSPLDLLTVQERMVLTDILSDLQGPAFSLKDPFLTHLPLLIRILQGRIQSGLQPLENLLDSLEGIDFQNMLPRSIVDFDM